ncbi:MAG: hypothetical protein IT455_05380 [Planctomycetes bacterium]|nr:hypothetical protein [Planctomycetota bacterium]
MTDADDITPDDNTPDGGNPDGGLDAVRPPWGQLDDTLADGPSPADVPPAARQWLAQQRTMHGLLRALHTADPAAREARVAGILERIDEHERARHGRGRWLLAAAAALLLAVFGTWWSLPAHLPTAEAAVQRAAEQLARDVDRRFRVVASVATERSGELRRHELALVVRPGSRFRVDGKFSFGGLTFGQMHAGCDGDELWFTAGNGLFRHAGPVAERERLQQRLGEVLDVGYLDIEQLVRNLPADFELRVVGRQRDADGRNRLVIEAVSVRADRGVKLRSARLECDEATGMVTRLDVECAAGPAVRRIELQYLGEEPAGLVDYQRPW